MNTGQNRPACRAQVSKSRQGPSVARDENLEKADLTGSRFGLDIGRHRETPDLCGPR